MNAQVTSWVTTALLATAIAGGAWFIKPKPASYAEQGKELAIALKPQFDNLKPGDPAKPLSAEDTKKLVDDTFDTKLGALEKRLDTKFAALAPKDKEIVLGGDKPSSEVVTVAYKIEAADIEAMIRSDKTRDKRFISMLQASHDRRMSEYRRKKTDEAELTKMEEAFQEILQKARVKHSDRRLTNRQELLDTIEELKAPSF